MKRLILPAIVTVLTLHLGGNLLVSAASITKAKADKLAVAMCQVADECY